MNTLNQYVVFFLDKQRYAMHISFVERVIRAVEITPLPKVPEIVLGVINVQGQIIPVVNIRKRFCLPERETNLSDQLIIAHTSRRVVVVAVDAVSGVIEIPGQKVVMAEKILSGLEYVEGVVKTKEGIIIIHDLDKFLSLDEEKALGKVMREKLEDRS